MSYLTKITTTKKKKPNRLIERDLKRGKKSYRLRIANDMEVEKELKDFNAKIILRDDC